MSDSIRGKESFADVGGPRTDPYGFNFYLRLYANPKRIQTDVHMFLPPQESKLQLQIKVTGSTPL